VLTHPRLRIDYAIGRSLSYDNPYATSTYHGSSTGDADDYLAYIERYATYRRLSEQQRLELLPVLLRDSAIDWYETLSHDEVSSWPNFRKSFLDRFGRTETTRFRDTTTLWSTSQATNETMDNYYSRMVNLARRLPHLDTVIICDAVIRGLRPSIRAKVLSAEVQTMKQLLDAARLAEMAISSDDDMMSSLLHELRTTKEQHTDEIRQLSSRLDKLSMTALDHHRDETSPVTSSSCQLQRSPRSKSVATTTLIYQLRTTCTSFDMSSREPHPTPTVFVLRDNVQETRYDTQTAITFRRERLL